MITVLSQPLEYEPAYSIDGSNLSIVVLSDEVANDSFRYVQQISVGGTVVAPFLPVAPNVEAGLGKGVIQPYRILQDYLSYDKYDAVGFTACPYSLVQYDVRLGEQSDGTIGGTGASVSIVYGATVSGYAWNGNLEYSDTYTFADYLMLTGSTGTDKFLTLAPSETRLSISESSFLYWLNGMGATGLTGNVPPTGATGLTAATVVPQNLAMEVRVYSDAVNYADWYILPRYDILPDTMQSAGVGPADLNRVSQAGRIYDDQGNLQSPFNIVSCATHKYEIRLCNYQKTSYYSEKRTYRITCACDPFQTFRFAWLNPLGGFDTYTFKFVSTRTINISRQEYTSFLSRYQESDDTFGYNPGDRGRKIYEVKAFDAHTVVSTWQTQEEHNWLAQLFYSQAQYLITTDSDGVIAYDPIIITSNSVSTRDVSNLSTNRKLSHTIEFVKAYNKVVQAG